MRPDEAQIRHSRPGSPGLLARTLEAAIGAYQHLVSPLLGQRCRFAPSCSEYAKQSIHRFGAFYGSWLALRRLLRCQPFSAGGWDPVPLERHSRHSRDRHSHQGPSQSTTTGATR
jgi:putative membrane protein insertion efficiency factor